MKENVISNYAVPHNVRKTYDPSRFAKEATCYYIGRRLIYAKIGDEHFTTNASWFDYLTRRKKQPRRVETFDKLKELRRKLREERHTLI